MQLPPPPEPEGRVLEPARSVSSEDPGPAQSIAVEITAVVVLTITTLGFATSLAVLVFSDALESGMERAIGAFVIGSGLMALVVGWRSRIVPPAIYVQEGPAILMAAVAADFIAIEGTTISDVFVLLFVTMLATSLATTAAAHFGLGGLGVAAPKPVVDAFIGGVGWLVIKGGVDVMTASTHGLADFGGLFETEVAQFWLPGLVVGVTAWLANRSDRTPDYAFCLVVCAALVAFYAIVALASSVSAVEAGGWLLGPFPETGSVKWVTPNEVRTANWSAIAKSTPGILSVVGIACVGVLINLTGIRSSFAPRLNVESELRTCAEANLAASLSGMTPGFQALGITLVLHRMGSTHRAVSLISGGLVLAVGIAGVTVVGYVPRFIVGSLLIMIGLALVDHWIRELRRLTSTAERLLSMVIVGAASWFGLLPGLGIGLVAAGGVFIASYSRLDPVRSSSNGALVRSRADRSPHEIERLVAVGDRLAIFELQGYLFFGSLAALQDQVRQVARGPDSVSTLVLDCADVTGLDSSGYEVIVRLLQELHHREIAVRVSALNPKFMQTMLDSEPELAAHIAFSPSLDAALESAEDLVLASTTTETMPRQLKPNLTPLSPELLSQCEAHRFQARTVVMAQGAPSNGLLIVQRGQLTSFRVEADGARTLLRRFGAFTVVGEDGLIVNTPRTAYAVTESVVDGWWLSIDRYHELRNTKPWLIFELHEFIMSVRADVALAP